MKAIVWTKYGAADVLQLQDVEQPVAGDDDVLVRIHAATVTAGDCEFRALKVPLIYRLPIRLYVGLIKPRRITILGQEFAGEVIATGKNVTALTVGDRIFAATGFNMGAYAEVKQFPQEGVWAAIPPNVSCAEAAAIPTGGLEALHFLRNADIKAGEKVLINGAGGSIGTFAIALARHYGAEVTAVDSTEKLDMLRSLGATHVVDYTKEDFSRNGQKYDVVFDVVGRRSFWRSMRALKPNGRYLMANPGIFSTVRSWWITASGSKRIIRGPASYSAGNLAHLAQLVASGVLQVVIDRRYPLQQLADAHRYVESGRKKGHVIVDVVGGSPTGAD